ncbi:MAG: serine hydrolase [Lentisphaeria bacterium]|nr:serine hydrolase [Lentisphaeria bacterium]
MNNLRQILEDGVCRKAFPCAAIAVVSPGKPTDIAVAGQHTYESNRPLLESDLFDLASLTKVIVTTTLTAKLVCDGKICLDDKVAEFLPEFLAPDSPDAAWRSQISIRHLLAHCSGMPAGYPFHQLPRSKNRDFRKILCGIDLLYCPGAQQLYSDLGMLLLGEILQECYQDTLDNLARKRIFTPVGMEQACYNPPVPLRCNCVPTEIRADIGISWQGVVHDETTRWLGGVAAHAGVFASIGDLCRFAEALLAGKGVFGHPAFAEFIRPANMVPGSSRCLGWDSNDNGLFGHTGFTGTSIWFNPRKQQAVILLSNAVHPHRTCKETAFLQFRCELMGSF